jgi:hypothetical protein
MNPIQKNRQVRILQQANAVVCPPEDFLEEKNGPRRLFADGSYQGGQMILVTGATGTVGRLVLDRLPAGRAVRVLARDPSRVAVPHEGVEVVRADYGDPAGLREALTGVHRALLVTTRVGGDDDAMSLRAAREAGVRQVVKLSAAAVVLGELLGRRLRFEEMEPTQARAALLRRHPGAVVEALLDSALRQKAGAKAQPLDTILAVTGSAPRSFRTWAQDHMGAFTLAAPVA